MKKHKFAAFILTHGRPDNISTIASLKRAGYTGDVYIVIDNEDERSQEYFDIFGDKVIVFDKLAISKTFDTGDNFNDRRAIVYARNFCFKLAKDLKLDYFVQLDDDYTEFQYRYDSDSNYKYKSMKNLDKVFSVMVDFVESTGVKSLAMAQGGDFIGGADSDNARFLTLKRKCMNTFVCSTKNPFTFLGGMNEDVTTYTRLASTGALFFTFLGVSIVQKQTQTNGGGMSDVYSDSGAYIKPFSSVIYYPSGVKVAMMHSTYARIHHRVSWNNTTPKIIDEKYKKKDNRDNE